MIVDAFIFYNEFDLLEYRLHLLYKYVDQIIIVESTHTFVGNEKELYYKNNINRFEKYNDKIIHIIVDDMPIQTNKHIQKSIWDNEFHQRNCIQRGLDKLKLNDNDIILLTDIDEIPNPNIFNYLNNSQLSINALYMDLYWYNLNRKNMEVVWKHPKILLYKYLKEQKIQSIRDMSYPPLFNCICGWHLSYFGDVNFIHNKLSNFAHQRK